MGTQKFILKYNEKEENFSTNFKNISRDFLQNLKDAELLPHVIVKLFPEEFSGEIIIDPFDPTNEDAYSVDFYLKLIATAEMKNVIKMYLNRDIDINKDDDSLSFSLRIFKESGYLEKVTDQEIILSF